MKGAPAASRNSLTRVASSSASDVPVSDSIAGGNERSVQYGARGEEGATTLLRTPGGSRATVGDARSSAAVSREATSGARRGFGPSSGTNAARVDRRESAGASCASDGRRTSRRCRARTTAAAPPREAPIYPLFCWAIGASPRGSCAILRRTDRRQPARASIERYDGARARRRGAASTSASSSARRRARRIAGTPDIAPAKSVASRKYQVARAKEKGPLVHPSHEQTVCKKYGASDVESLGETQSRCSRRRIGSQKGGGTRRSSLTSESAPTCSCAGQTPRRARRSTAAGSARSATRAREVVRTKARRKSARRATSRRASRGVPRGGVLRRGRFRASLDGSR